MDFPRGHAALPLTEPDFLDFIYNYFKAEYYPIRSFWSTAAAVPQHSERWISMGHELAPLMVRPANAQAQKDLESLDYFTRRWNLDAGFVRGLVIRFAKYEVHERLEKKLYECARLDLMVRKALKEKHLIDALWPSPAPRNIPKELLQQGVQVRQWYGDMFHKYFRVLRSLDDFQVRPEVDSHIKSSGTLMLLPFVDHLIFGTVDPIMPIVAKGAGYSNARNLQRPDHRAEGFGEPGKFEIRFDAPAEVTDTYTKTVVRQCQCMKCGTKRDVQVIVSVDPSPDAGVGRRSTSGDRRRDAGEAEPAPPRQPPRPQRTVQSQESSRPSTPDLKKQCPRCTFLNHPNLTACEMCEATLPEATIAKPPSPAEVRAPSHSHSASEPPPTAPNPRQEELKKTQRPNAPNRHSLSSSLFSIFPFSQQHQQEHHAKLPATQTVDTQPATQSTSKQEPQTPSRQQKESQITPPMTPHAESSSHRQTQPTTSAPPPDNNNNYTLSDPPLSQHPEMAMLPLSPSSPPSTATRRVPAGLPSNLMDDFVPVSPAYAKQDVDDDEDAGWGSVSREEARHKGDADSDVEEARENARRGLIDLDAVAREEADVWGDRDD
ncbi:uncharacterized protein SETTUDRAFT_92286 [Exserohilum turcica Et28A]|uniref:RanBP2-type domain-containing protein n=1 Tax=Exserohilum turcicum (strain 28A) TaxID=671987 RepID=R0K650_EXST2|nr:uncharacterized protein SETTUDRAFT_92286 [Exserohilum turcica Et28A]EOA83797.1 hypothetical protein SETTUDRAFT_92286 [Exserohilum turcica Et28A]